MTDFKNIPLKSITADPNQPRKFFDEQALQELTDSVKANGILQPILVRPSGKDSYLLVCGERRYRAAVAVAIAIKDRNTIPAIIRELTDQEALELQIVENLQRKDVHPMEEAVAFKSLLDHKQFSVLEIAARVGKSDFYVRQRLKLNDLSANWQSAFFSNTINLKDAMQICQLHEKAQESLYKDKGVSKLSVGAKIQIDSWTMDRYKGELHKAAFDTSDATLDKKIGACTGCQFNTSVSLLFPEHAKSPRCMNVACFNKKSDTHLSREVKNALEDPTVILVNNTYNSSNDLLKKLKVDGHVVMKQHDDYSEVDVPEHPDLEELKGQYEEELEEGEKKMEEINQEYDELLVQHEKDMDAYNKKVSSGKYKKAFVVCGGSDELGKYIYIDLKQKGQTKSAKAVIESGADVTVADIDQELTRLETLEKRNKELDAEKVHTVVKEIISNSKEFTTGTAELSITENAACAIAMWQAGSSDFRKKVSKIYNIKGDTSTIYYATYSCPPALFKKLNVTSIGLNELLRLFILDKLVGNGGSRLAGGDDVAVHEVALLYHPDAVNKALLEQEEIAAKRQERVNKRIADLQKQKKELQPPAKKATKAKADKPHKPTPIKKGISSLLNNNDNETKGI